MTGKKQGVLLLLMWSAVWAHGQTAPDPRNFGSLITAATLRSHLQVLTADSLAGRETGEPGAEKAANFIREHFRKIGLKPALGSSYFQNVPLLSQSFSSVKLQIGSYQPVHLKDFFYLRQRNGNGGQLRAASVLLMTLPSSGEEMARTVASLNLKDRIILLLSSKKRPTLKPQAELTRLLKALAPLRSKSPAAILVDNDNLATSLAGNAKFFKETYLDNKTLIPPSNKNILASSLFFVLSSAATKQILSTGGSDLETALTTLSKRSTQSLVSGFSLRLENNESKVEAQNVLGLLPGTDLKNETLVISAHYDHLGIHGGKIFHGADDDGSGTAALMEMAEAFSNAKKAGKAPRRSILFLANVGEEKGLLGSQYYSEHPAVPISRTIVDLNIDMIGRTDSTHLKDTNYVYVIGSGKLSSELQAVSESVNRLYGDLTLDYKYDNPADSNQFYYRSDHYNFAKLNIPIIFYFNGVHADYHQPSDTIEKISFGLFAKRTRLIFYTAWELANRVKRPFVNRVSDFK